MTEEKKPDSSGKIRVCPKCRLPLVRKGGVVDTGKFKQWIEEWHCAEHGKVDLPEQPKK